MSDEPLSDRSLADRSLADQPLADFAEDMRLLRAHCPWKAEQTHRSLERYLLEEAHEVLEAIDAGDLAHLREELGDLLLQVFFHAAIAEEAGEFTLDDVARGIGEKMRRRNPHVFAEGSLSTAEGSHSTAEGSLSAADVNAIWQDIKLHEKPRDSVLDGIPATLPALLLATKLLERQGRGPADPSTAESDPSAVEGDPSAIGERLLAVVGDAVGAGVDPEQALRDAVRRHAQARPSV